MADQNEENNQNDEYSNLGADLEAAWDDSTDTEVETVEPVVAEVIEAEPVEAEPVEEAVAVAVAEGAEDAPTEITADDTAKAPVGLPPEAREAWKDTPPAMQKAIAKREKEFNVGIQKYAEGAKRAEGMDKALQPFQQYLSMNGGSNHIGTLLQTGASLQMGSPIQKAQTIAKMIKDFGIDVHTLDSMLVGEGAPPQVQQQSDVQQAVTTAMAPYQQFMGSMQQQQQQQQQQAQQGIVSDVQAFATDPKNEFYNDVSPMMATIMDVAAANNENLTLPQAYDRACKMDQSISTIIASRQSATDVAAKRKAASSITGTPGGPGGGAPEHDDPRAAIAAAWENYGRT
jgi:hypothetical protein